MGAGFKLAMSLGTISLAPHTLRRNCILVVRLTKGVIFIVNYRLPHYLHSPFHLSCHGGHTSQMNDHLRNDISCDCVVAWPTPYQPAATSISSLRLGTVSSYHAFMLCAYSHYHCAHVWMKPHSYVCVCV